MTVTVDTQPRPSATEVTTVRKKGTLDELVAAGLATPPTRDIADLPSPLPPIPGMRPLSEEVMAVRRGEDY